jgi:hypothetical protein
MLGFVEVYRPSSAGFRELRARGNFSEEGYTQVDVRVGPASAHHFRLAVMIFGPKGTEVVRHDPG